MSNTLHPKEWSGCLICEIANVIAGGTPKAGNPENFTEPASGIAWLTPADLSGYKRKYISHGARDLSQTGYDSSSAKLMPKGSILFSSRAPIGYIAIAANEICTNQGFKSFVLPDDIDSSYAYFYFRSIRDLAESWGTGTTFKEISGATAKKLPFSLPPLAEQKEIAAQLDDLLAQVDTLKNRLDGIPAILKRFRQSTLATATSGKLTEQWRKNNHADHWRDSTMDKTFKCIDGDRGPNYPKKTEYKSEGHCLFLSTKNVREFGFDFSNQVFLEKEKHEKLRNGTLSRGDLIITTRGTLGYVASYDDSVPFDVVRINSGMLILRKINADFVNDFFKCVIASPQFQKMVNERRTGSAQPQLPAKILKQFELNIPSVPEQTEIVRRVEALFAFADQVERRVKDTQTHVNHLTQSILAKAFHGELTADWRAANSDLITGENSAAALLERIKAERVKLTPKKKMRKKG